MKQIVKFQRSELPSANASTLLLDPRDKEGAEDEGAVVFGVAGGVKQRDVVAARKF